MKFIKDIKRHAFGAATIGSIGLLIGIGMVQIDASWQGGFLPGGGYLVPSVALVGAAIAGFACAPMFGSKGGTGWFWALMGGVLATVLGALIGGAIVMPVYGSLFGVIAVADYLATHPVLLVTWCVTMAMTHQAFMLLMPHRN